MGALLPLNQKIREATAAEKMAGVLDSIQGTFLPSRSSEWKVRKKGETTKDIIDISSAATMHLFEEVGGKRVSVQLRREHEQWMKKFESYPSLMEPSDELEQTFCRFLRRWIKVKFDPKEVTVCSGVYGAYRTILLSQPGQYVIIPEFIHNGHKACFAALGKTVIEIPVRIYDDNLLDLDFLAKILEKHKNNIACVYLYHTKPARLTRSYWSKIAHLLASHKTLGVIDCDAWYVAHEKGVMPWLPLTVPLLRKQCLYLFNLTKETGTPGLRIGFVLGPETLTTQLKKFQQLTLEMISPVSGFFARTVLANIDIHKSRTLLQGRMKALVLGLQSLGFKTVSPPSGVNFFLHVPIDFEKTTSVLPDHLFTYYLLTRAGVLVRPGSSHGHRLNHYVRLVLCQPKEIIETMIQKMKRAGIHADMAMPEGIEKEYRGFIESTK